MKAFMALGRVIPHIIIEEGQVWVSLREDPTFFDYYEKIEVLRGEDSGRGGNSERDGRRSGDRTGRTSRSYPHKPESQYGIRDHRPMNSEYAAQARLYAAQYLPDKSELWRRLYGH